MGGGAGAAGVCEEGFEAGAEGEGAEGESGVREEEEVVVCGVRRGRIARRMGGFVGVVAALEFASRSLARRRRSSRSAISFSRAVWDSSSMIGSIISLLV